MYNLLLDEQYQNKKGGPEINVLQMISKYHLDHIKLHIETCSTRVFNIRSTTASCAVPMLYNRHT